MQKNDTQLLDLDRMEIQPIDDDALTSIAGGCNNCSCGSCSVIWPN
jgi:hypothetical protein